MTELYAQSDNLLYAALHATYAASLALLADPDRLATWLKPVKRRGLPSANPHQPIVRQIW